jgi:hypothetical protein
VYSLRNRPEKLAILPVSKARTNKFYIYRQCTYIVYISPTFIFGYLQYLLNCIGGVMVSMLASSAVDLGFEPWSGQTKDYKIDICCFSAKHTALRSKSKDWFAQNQNNVSEWGDMSIRGLLFQWASTIKKKLSIWSWIKWTSSSSQWKLTCSRHDIAEKLLSWH